MLYGFGLSLLFSILLCVHVVRTNQPMYWLMIILMLQPLGGVVYLVAVVAPQVFGGTAAQRMGAATRAALDPGRDYREAAAALDRTPTVQNRLRLAKAASALGRWEEAEQLFDESASGIHAQDPVLLLGRAQALVELGRHQQALETVQRLAESDEEAARSPQATLILARAWDGLGDRAQAENAYRWSVERMPGLEALSRWAVFLARTGRTAEAREQIAEMDRHIERAAPQFRKEYRAWRELAARAL